MSNYATATTKHQPHMKAYTYIDHGHFALTDKPIPQIKDPKDAIVKVTLSSICTSDLHIKHGSVPRAVPGITVGHEMVGIVESVIARMRFLKTPQVLMGTMMIATLGAVLFILF